MGNLLTMNNSKLKADGIHVWSLEAGKTCPMAAACAKYCYAKKGAYTWPGTVKKRRDNFQLTLRDDFVALMNAEIKSKKKIHTVRVHDSGDFYNSAYLEKWIQISKDNPAVVFYAYTKSVLLVKNHILPENLRVTFSIGGLQDNLITPADRQARIFNDFETMTSEGYANASHSDLVTAYGPVNKIGLIAH
jgi:Gene product 88